MHKHNTKQNRPTGLSAGGAFLCAEAWQSGLLHRATPRRTFGHPTPSQRPVSSNLAASTIKPVGPSPLARKRPPITAPGMSPTRQPFWSIHRQAWRPPRGGLFHNEGPCIIADTLGRVCNSGWILDCSNSLRACPDQASTAGGVVRILLPLSDVELAAPI